MIKAVLLVCLLTATAICVSSNANANAVKDKSLPPPALDPTNPASDVLTDLKAFSDWKVKYNKAFETEEDKFRFQVFVKNKNDAKKHNDNANKKFKMDTNQFAAETPEEFAAKHLGGRAHDASYLEKIKNLKKGEILAPVQVPTVEEIQALIEKQKQANSSKPANETSPVVVLDLPNPNANANADKSTKTNPSSTRNLQIVPPSAVNWTERHMVTPVRDQGSCGACYAFSAIAGVESAYLIDLNQTIALSEQHLVDCSIFLGNFGCNGGWTDYALNYIIYFNATSRDAYPYQDAQGICQYVVGEYPLTTYVFAEGCSGLMNEVQNRPVVVALDAQSWQLYSEGILNNCLATGWDRLNHAALLVGIDQNQNWIVKNSWGRYWGELGYIRLQAGEMCSICLFPGVSPYL